MKKLLLFLSLLWISNACIVTNSTNIVNQTNYMNISDCLFIEDLNYTIFINKLNVEYNLTAGNMLTNNECNITINAKHKQINTLTTLDYGANYINSNTNETIVAPLYPKANSVIQLNYNSNYSNSTLNLTVLPPQKLDLVQNLDYGENYTQNDLNLTVFGSSYPKINEEITVNCEGKKEYTENNLTILGGNCYKANLEILAGYGTEPYILSDINVTVLSPQKLNLIKKLGMNEEYLNSDIGLNLICGITEENLINECSKVISSYDNVSLFNSVEFCTFEQENSNLTDMATCVIGNYCTLEEKWSKNVNSCVNRMISDTKFAQENAQNQITISDTKLAECNTLLGTVKDTVSATNNDKLNLWESAGLGLLICAIIVGAYEFTKNKRLPKGDIDGN